MNRVLLATFLGILLLAPALQAKTLGGVELPETLAVHDDILVLNGAGMREKWFLDIYVAGLYLAKPSSDAKQIIEADAPMAIALHLVSGMLTSEKMQAATEEGFENATGGKTEPIRPFIDAFIDVFREKLEKGDEFDISYQPGTGVEITKNGKHQATIDGGLPFKRALFGIWLSDKPAQESLKQALLGK